MSDYWAVVQGICAVCVTAAIIGGILLSIKTQMNNKRRIVAWLVGACVIFAVSALCYFASIHAQTPASGSNSTGKLSVGSQSSPTNTPSPIGTQATQSSDNITPTSGLTSSPEVSMQRLPLEMGCTRCDKPVGTIINSITSDAQSMRMTITLFNRSGSKQSYSFRDFTLKDSLGSAYMGTGDVLNSSYYELDPGQSKQWSVIFSTVPLANESYTLNVQLSVYSLSQTTQYDPITLVF